MKKMWKKSCSNRACQAAEKIRPFVPLEMRSNQRAVRGARKQIRSASNRPVRKHSGRRIYPLSPCTRMSRRSANTDIRLVRKQKDRQDEGRAN